MGIVAAVAMGPRTNTNNYVLIYICKLLERTFPSLSVLIILASKTEFKKYCTFRRNNCFSLFFHLLILSGCRPVVLGIACQFSRYTI